MIHGTSFFAGLLALAVTGGVPSTATKVYVTPASSGLAAIPRPWKCKVDFIRAKAPDRPYDELGGLFARGSMEPREIVEALSRKACGVGADAILVTRDFATELAQHPEVPIDRSLFAPKGMELYVTVGTMTGTAIRYRTEAGTPAIPAPGACQFALSVGRWSLCQLESSAVYVKWTGDGSGVSAKFTYEGKGEWFLRRGENVDQLKKKQCRGENSPDCRTVVRTRAGGERWDQPATAAGASVKEETRFDLGETRFVLTEGQIQVELPDDQRVWFPADRAVPKTGNAGFTEDL